MSDLIKNAKWRNGDTEGMGVISEFDKHLHNVAHLLGLQQVEQIHNYSLISWGRLLSPYHAVIHNDYYPQLIVL